MSLEEKSAETSEYILENIEQLDYGTVVVTVHNGEVTQVDVTEKKRFPDKK